METLKVNVIREEEITITFPCYLKNASSDEMVVYNNEKEGIEIKEYKIQKAELSLKSNFKYYTLATKEEFYSLFDKTKSNINSLLIMASDVDSLPQPQGELEPIIEAVNKEFPSDFDSWQEAHFDISTAIGEALMCDGSNEAIKVREEIGTGGIYDFAKCLTNKFEMVNKGVVWGDEKEYYDTMEEFIKQEIFILK